MGDAINGCYVDDVPMTAPTEEEVVKIASNSKEVLKSVPEELRAKNFKDLEGEHGSLMVLGLVYGSVKDNLRVRADKKEEGEREERERERERGRGERGRK